MIHILYVASIFSAVDAKYINEFQYQIVGINDSVGIISSNWFY